MSGRGEPEAGIVEGQTSGLQITALARTLKFVQPPSSRRRGCGGDWGSEWVTRRAGGRSRVLYKSSSEKRRWRDSRRSKVVHAALALCVVSFDSTGQAMGRRP